ncbi:hypothetical protein BRADI_4g44510v3 [Brachypodium distachyon]|uniref:Peroxidase n=1 Tax=Brachypodium distachyon TaxID=15368 RepID=A0A0Q3PST8_BRADI|nr:hypothetical protein BRADI_4g44510v3 [Brachypodium distachyon]
MAAGSWAQQQLSTGFYSASCPGAQAAVRSAVESAIGKETRIGASILQLFFHDCFVQGCDGSLLLDDTAGFQGEKTAAPNNGSVRGFEVVDDAKAAVERICPGVVSCADVLALAARDSVVLKMWCRLAFARPAGPSWEVKLGRRDSTTASFAGANANMPAATSGLRELTDLFANQGLSQKDMVALSGSHTLGQARCVNFDIDSGFAGTHRSSCSSNSVSGDGNSLAPLDLQTPLVFENNYYKNLVDRKGLLHSDQELFNGGVTDQQVRSYVDNQSVFFADFLAGMIKLGDISPLTGTNGQIRKNCRRIN